MTTIDENADFLPMYIDYTTQLHKLDNSLHRLYLLCEGNGNTALRISSSSPLIPELITSDEGDEPLGFLRFIREGDLGDDWDVDTIHKNYSRADNRQVRELFHACWTAALSTSSYKKSDWMALQKILEQFGYML